MKDKEAVVGNENDDFIDVGGEEGGNGANYTSKEVRDYCGYEHRL